MLQRHESPGAHVLTVCCTICHCTTTGRYAALVHNDYGEAPPRTTRKGLCSDCVAKQPQQQRDPRGTGALISRPQAPHLEEKGGAGISWAEQIAEAQRELALGKKGYPQWVKAGKLDPGGAQYQLRVMEEMVRTRMRLDAEPRQRALFGDRL